MQLIDYPIARTNERRRTERRKADKQVLATIAFAVLMSFIVGFFYGNYVGALEARAIQEANK